MGKVNPNYCSLLTDILLKYDYFNILDAKSLGKICGRLEYINFLLNKYYEIIFNRNLNKKQAIKKLVSIKDRDNNKILNKSEANKIYDKFLELQENTSKGGSDSKRDYDISKNQDEISDLTGTISKTNRELNNNIENERNLKIKLNKEKLNLKKKKEDRKKCNIPIKNSSKNLKKKIDKLDNTKKNLREKIRRSKYQLEVEKNDLRKKKQDYIDDIQSDIDQKNELLDNSKDKLTDLEIKLSDQQNKIESIKSSVNKDKDKLKDPLICLDGDCDENKKLSGPQESMIKNNMDMMEVLLICLSLLPIAGWTFDLPLFIYALIKKKYNLAIITVLNWYIWGFWLIFGLNVNMGPSMKVTYLGNKENYMKNSLLNGVNNPNKYMDPYTDVSFKMIDGRKYLVDKKGNIYEPKIKNPNIIGIWDKSSNKMIKKSDPKYYKFRDKNK